MTITDSTKAFVNYLQSLNYARRTYQSYNYLLSAFVGFTGDHKVSEITVEHIQRYRDSLIERNLKGSTMRQHALALRAYADYLKENQIHFIEKERIKLPIRNEPFIYIPSQEEVNKILDCIPNDEIGIRNRALVELLLATGCRLSELHYLNKTDIDMQQGQFVVLGKGHKPRTCYMTPRAIEWLRRWLDVRDDGGPALFLSLCRGGMQVKREADDYRRLATNNIERLVKRYVLIAGADKRITVHTFRHYFATRMIENGMDVFTLQQLLGHANVATTQRYIHLSRAFVKKQYIERFKY